MTENCVRRSEFSHIPYISIFGIRNVVKWISHSSKLFVPTVAEHYPYSPYLIVLLGIHRLFEGFFSKWLRVFKSARSMELNSFCTCWCWDLYENHVNFLISKTWNMLGTVMYFLVLQYLFGTICTYSSGYPGTFWYFWNPVVKLSTKFR